MKIGLHKTLILNLIGALALLALAGAPRLRAQTLTNLYRFTAGRDGDHPESGVILSGNTLYGTTYGYDFGESGGSNGTVFKVNTDGTDFETLHTFTGGNDGGHPLGKLVLSGNTLFGTTEYGGTNSSLSGGVVFSVNTDGNGFRVLHSFSGGTNGLDPAAGLILSNNTLYGTTKYGGYGYVSGGYGTVFKVGTDGTAFATLHQFNPLTDGAWPQARLVLSGNSLYGTALGQGRFDGGTVFKVSTDGHVFDTLHAFTFGDDGAYPDTGLVLSSNTLYGTASGGGASTYFGTVFKLNTDGTNFSTLYVFKGNGNPPYASGTIGALDGSNPDGDLVLLGDTLYGTTSDGGWAHFGTVFQIYTDGTSYRTLYAFTSGLDGYIPQGGVVSSLYGNKLYGTTTGGNLPTWDTLDTSGSPTNGAVFGIVLRPQPEQYDAVASFSTNFNSLGVWSYMWSTNLGSAFMPLTTQLAKVDGISQQVGWSNGRAFPDSCFVMANLGTNDISDGTVTYGADVLRMDPQGHAVAVRFTAPTAGYYTAQGLFRLIDTESGAHPRTLQVREDNSTVLFNQDTSGGGFGAEYPFHTNLFLGANETLEFVVSSTGDASYLGTGLKVTVAPATAPATGISLAAIHDGETLTSEVLPALVGSASAPSGIASVQVYLNRFTTNGVFWWDGTNWSPNSAVLTAQYDPSTALWQVTNALPSGANLPNADYQVQVSAQTKASPSQTMTLNASFSVKVPSMVTLNTITNGQTVTSQVLPPLLGSASAPLGIASVQVYLNRFTTNGLLWWNGSNWSPSSAALAARYDLSTALWQVTNALPSGTNLPNAGYQVQVSAQNNASPPQTTGLGVTFSVKVPPVLTLETVTNGETFTDRVLPTLIGSASASPAITSVQVYLNRFQSGGALWWNGSSWTTNAASLTASYDPQTAIWQLANALPSSANLPNADYQLQVGAGNNASPPVRLLLTVDFSVDYHPVYVFTAGSYSDNDPNNNNMNWDNPANWNMGSVPTPDADVVITGNAPDNTSLGSVTVYRLDLSGGTLTTQGMLIHQLNLSGGEINSVNGGAIDISSNGVFNWSGGELAGSYGISPGAVLNVRGNAQKLLADGASLLNQGTITWQGGAPITVNGDSGPSMITNAVGAVFQLAGDGELFSQANGYYTMVFANDGGLFAKTGGTNTVVDTCTFENRSEVRAGNGTLTFNATLDLNPGGTFTGAGSSRVTGGTVTVAGETTVADSSLELADGQFQGAADGSGTFATTGTGRLVWSGGTLLTGTLNLATNAQVEIRGGTKTFLDGAALNNEGRITWSAGAILANGDSSPSFITNSAGASFTITGTNLASRINGYYDGEFDNAPGATLVMDAPGKSPWTGWQLINDGEVSCIAGTLRLEEDGAAAGVFTNSPGAELQFAGGTDSLHAGTRFVGTGTVRVAGATLTADGYVTAGESNSPGLFILDRGTLNGAGFTSLGRFQWNGGTLGGAFSNAPGAVLTITGLDPTVLADSAVFNNAGVAQLTGGRLYANGDSAASTWNNFPGGRFDIASDGGVFAQNNGYYVVVFNNDPGARLAKTAGTNSVLDTCVINNGGELRSDSGTLALNTTLNLNPGSTFAGAGQQDILGGAVTWSGTNSVQGTVLSLTGGTLTGITHATLVSGDGGRFDWSGGTLAGALTLAPDTPMGISGTGQKLLADEASLLNQGTITWQGGAPITANGDSGPSMMTNAVGAVFQVAGDGKLFSQANGYYTMVFANDGGIFTKTAGTNTVVDTCTFENRSEIRAAIGTLTFNATLDLNPGGTFTGAGSSRVAGGTVNVAGKTTVTDSTLELANGQFQGAADGSGTFATTGTGRLVWSGGSVGGTLNLAAGGSFSISGTASKVLSDSAVLNNAGTLSLNSSGPLQANGDSAISTVNNLSSGVIQVMTHTTWGRNSGYYRGQLNNDGTLSLDGSPELFQADWDYTQSASGTLSELVTGSAPGTEFSQANFAGHATLNGTLAVTFGNGFTPTNSQSFAVIHYGSHSGQFSSVQLAGQGQGLTGKVDYGATATSLVLNLLPKIRLESASDGNLEFSGSGGTPGQNYYLLMTTNIVLPLSNWTPVATNQFDSSGDFHFTSTVDTGPGRYFSIEVP